MKQNMYKMAAITVTFNSSHFLKRVIEALENQTYLVDEIVVVDNNSNEENKENIRKLLKNKEHIHIIWMKENLGGAGGFNAGMQYAQEKLNPDWYWLMDDDAFPREDCLYKLMQYTDYADNIGCLQPLIWGVDHEKYQLYHHKRESKLLLEDIAIVSNAAELEEITPIEASAFVGPLFSRAAVEQVGIADGTLFIYGDDLEYTYRVSREFKVLLVRDAVINHQDPPLVGGVFTPKTWWKDYYCWRNRIFFIKKYTNNPLRRFEALALFGFMLGKKVLRTFLVKEYSGYKKLRISIIWNSWKDGLLNRRGKTIDPVDYQKKLLKMQEKNVG
mgnify:CR=1 FL=1